MQLVQSTLARNHRHSRMKLPDLLREPLDVISRDQSVDGEAIRPSAHDVKRAGADGAGRAKEREESHSTPIISLDQLTSTA